jgi:hypothetical protein
MLRLAVIFQSRLQRIAKLGFSERPAPESVPTPKLPNGMARREFADTIKSAYEENSAIKYCSWCEHRASKD